MRGGRALALLPALLLAACGPGPVDEERPNVVLVIADDLAWIDHGFLGADHARTPTLDRLAAEGTVLRHGYNTASVCRPSLRSLLTGLHPIQLHALFVRLANAGTLVPHPDLLAEVQTLPGLLGGVGYRSFQAGKFFERDYRVAGFDDGMQAPEARFDFFSGEGRKLGRASGLEPVRGFLDGVGDAPFFLWFAPMLPHTPHDADPTFEAPFEGRGISAPARRYYANIARFDALVAELLELLARRGVARRTLIVYLADNGWDQPFDADDVRGFPDGPRGKGTLYELGWRTPIVFHWPGVVPAGVVSDALVSTVDLFPTLLEVAGVPAEQPARTGRSLWPLVRDGAPWSRDAVLGWQEHARVPDASPQGHRLRGRGRLKQAGFVLRDRESWFVWYRTLDARELYDAEADPRALDDRAPSEPARVAAYEEQLRRWQWEQRASVEELPAWRQRGDAPRGPAPSGGEASSGPPGVEGAPPLP